MSTKHTQEEWHAFGTEIVTMPSQIKISNRISGMTYEESRWNANLIAAAPELLKFAKAFSEILANGEMDIYAKEGFNKKVADMVGLNIEAIKKATHQP